MLCAGPAGTNHWPPKPSNGSDALALQAICHGAVTWQRLEDLKRAGASGLLVLPVERMLA